MTSSIGKAQTPHAARCLKQLCRHFSLEISVVYDETEGHAQFPFGQCWLSAEADSLTFRCEAKELAGLARLQEVIDLHVKMFTQSNPLTVTWQKLD